MKKVIRLGFPEILESQVYGTNIPLPWFYQTGYSGLWLSPKTLSSKIWEARQCKDDEDRLGDFAYQTTVFGYIDPFSHYLKDLGYQILVESYKKWLEQGDSFFVPVPSSEFRCDKWGRIEPSELRFPSERWKGQIPEDLKKALRSGQARFLFYGNWEITAIYPEDLAVFCAAENIPESSVIVCSPDTELPAKYSEYYNGRENRPIVIQHTAFENFPWVGGPVGPSRESQKFRYYEDLRNRKKKYKLMCLNRRWSPERVYTVGYLKGSGVVGTEEDVLLSLGAKYKTDSGFIGGKEAISEIENFFPGSTKARKVAIQYFDSLSLHQGVCFSPDLNPYSMENDVQYNAMQEKAYVNLVTETSFPYNSDIFFTEKTFKPIWGIQPFVLVGAAYSLQRLQDMGYKTFARWWDESYDTVENTQERLEAIFKVVNFIRSLSLDDLHEMCLEMEEVLLHNFNHYIHAYEKGIPEMTEKLYKIQSKLYYE